MIAACIFSTVANSPQKKCKISSSKCSENSHFPLILCGYLRLFAAKKIAVVTNYRFSEGHGKMRFERRARARLPRAT